MPEDSWTEVRNASIKAKLPFRKSPTVLVKVVAGFTYEDAMRAVFDENPKDTHVAN